MDLYIGPGTYTTKITRRSASTLLHERLAPFGGAFKIIILRWDGRANTGWRQKESWEMEISPIYPFRFLEPSLRQGKMGDIPLVIASILESCLGLFFFSFCFCMIYPDNWGGGGRQRVGVKCFGLVWSSSIFFFFCFQNNGGTRGKFRLFLFCIAIASRSEK